MDPKSGLDHVWDVLVQDGENCQIAPEIKDMSRDVIDATGLVVAPGLVDIHAFTINLVKDIHTGRPKGRCRWFPLNPVAVMAIASSTISDVETLQEVLQSAAKEKINVKICRTYY